MPIPLQNGGPPMISGRPTPVPFSYRGPPPPGPPPGGPPNMHPPPGGPPPPPMSMGGSGMPMGGYPGGLMMGHQGGSIFNPGGPGWASNAPAQPGAQVVPMPGAGLPSGPGGSTMPGAGGQTPPPLPTAPSPRMGAGAPPTMQIQPMPAGRQQAMIQALRGGTR